MKTSENFATVPQDVPSIAPPGTNGVYHESGNGHLPVNGYKRSPLNTPLPTGILTEIRLTLGTWTVLYQVVGDMNPYKYWIYLDRIIEKDGQRIDTIPFEDGTAEPRVITMSAPEQLLLQVPLDGSVRNTEEETRMKIAILLQQMTEQLPRRAHAHLAKFQLNKGPQEFQPTGPRVNMDLRNI